VIADFNGVIGTPDRMTRRQASVSPIGTVGTKPSRRDSVPTVCARCASCLSISRRSLAEPLVFLDGLVSADLAFSRHLDVIQM
jgi:hypothetical protein